MSAVLSRPVVEQAESVSSYAANPTQVQQVPQAPYISPYVSMNYTYNKAVLQLRDSESGEVVQQIPSDTQLRAYRRAAQQQPAIYESKKDVVTERAQSAAPVSAAPVPVAAPVAAAPVDDGADSVSFTPTGTDGASSSTPQAVDTSA